MSVARKFRRKRERDKPTRILLLRYGGVGDTLIENVPARQLAKRYPGAEIDFAVRAEIANIMRSDPVFNRILPTKRMPPSNMDCIESAEGWVSVESVKEEYDYVFDFKFSIEQNTLYRNLHQKFGLWCQSMNSNYVNWIDMQLAWCNIDPTTVPAEERVPQYFIEDAERDFAKQKLAGRDNRTLIGVHLRASSLARTWYKASELPDRLRTLMPEAWIVAFNDAERKWILFYPNGDRRLIDASGENGLRLSAAIVDEMDLLICADSGFSHIAAALETPTLTVYSTVPPWTRERDYPYAHSVSPKMDCSPCFTLDGYCPEHQRRARKNLTPRENKVLELAENGVQPQDAARELNTVPGAVVAEFNAIQDKMKAFAAQEPDCMRKVTPEMLAEEAQRILEEVSE